MQQALLSAADTLGRMIQSARRDLAGGRAIDATRIEAVVINIHRIVEDNAEAVRRDGAALRDRLHGVMAELAELEAELLGRDRAGA